MTNLIPKTLLKPISIALLIFLSIVIFPSFFKPTGTGLDRSWGYAISYLFSEHATFGVDVIFPYGPLGFLIAPCYFSANQIFIDIFLISFFIIINLSICIFLFHKEIKDTDVLFIVFLTITYSLSLQFDTLIILFTGILCYISTNNKILLYIMPLFIALTLFMKFTIFLPLLSMYIMTIIILLKTRTGWITIAASLLTLICSVLLFSIALGMDLNAVYLYIFTSLQYSFGYGMSLSIVGNPFILMLGIFLTLLFYIELVLHRRTESIKIYIIFSISILFAFKHGFVRQDAHVLRFFPFMLGVFAVTLLGIQTKKQFLYAASALILTLAVTVPIALRYDNQFLERITGMNGMKNIVQVINYNDSMEQMRVLSEEYLAADKLPDEWVSAIGQASVDVVPSEIAYCPANNLRWNHNPLIQFVNACIADFDRISSLHFQGANSPDYIIAEFSSVDYRHIFTDVPLTWQRIIQNYSVIKEDYNANRILLEKLSYPEKYGENLLLADRLKFNQVTKLPASDNLLIVRITMKLNLVGVVANAVFRIPPVMMDVYYEDGTIYNCRIVPDSFKNGVILNYFPRNIQEVGELIKKQNRNKVVGFRIYGDGCFYFLDDSEMSFSELTSIVP